MKYKKERKEEALKKAIEITNNTARGGQVVNGAYIENLYQKILEIYTEIEKIEK